MSVSDQEEDIYIIPHNFKENGKILGIIDQQSFYIGLGWLVVWFFIFYLIPYLELGSKIMIYVFIAVLPAALIFVGFGHDTIFDFIKYYINFRKEAKVYHYEK